MIVFVNVLLRFECLFYLKMSFFYQGYAQNGTKDFPRVMCTYCLCTKFFDVFLNIEFVSLFMYERGKIERKRRIKRERQGEKHRKR